ncbi:hypothetical protein DFH07DRAFT_1066091 [Mycena maculata]|uniref:Uncharacterized protein n=1 Tax=Mycena maculata TaxID=230809 RepID=A0AAD7HX07_9AGAR|nr:hypothetical protein DFH07DRAFT_1066091 [Mycena maculata]
MHVLFFSGSDQKIRDLLQANEDSKNVAGSLKPIHEHLVGIRAELESLGAYAPLEPASETDLWNYSSVQEIDKMRVDGKFLDAEGGSFLLVLVLDGPALELQHLLSLKIPQQATLPAPRRFPSAHPSGAQTSHAADPQKKRRRIDHNWYPLLSLELLVRATPWQFAPKETHPDSRDTYGGRSDRGSDCSKVSTRVAPKYGVV